MAVVCGLYEKLRACLKSSRCHQSLLDDDDDIPVHSVLPAGASSPRCTSLEGKKGLASTTPSEPLALCDVERSEADSDPWTHPVQSLFDGASYAAFSGSGSSGDGAPVGSSESAEERAESDSQSLESDVDGAI